MIFIKKVLKTYKSSLGLIISMIIGLILGLILKEKATILEPLGSLFINLLCCLIVPIIFTSLTLALANVEKGKTTKIIKTIALVFCLYSIVSIIWGIFVTKSFNLISNNIVLEKSSEVIENNNIFRQFFNMLSVNDFAKLLSKDNLIAVMVMAFLCGIVLNKSKDELLINFTKSVDNLLAKLLEIIMWYAPVGIGAYMAYTVGELGISLVTSYLKVFTIYLIAALLFAIVFYSLIARICNYPIKDFWKKSMPVIATSLSTCSSAATMPINIMCANNIINNEPVNKTTISLGTSFHKDGSTIDSVFKIMFLVSLFSIKISIFRIIIIALIATLLISAVPVGGGTISELLIISMLGLPSYALPVLTIIATITDAPATMLNALGDTSAILLVNKRIKKDAIS